MNFPQTIEEVVQALDRIIDWCKMKNSKMGYFACLYKQTTIAVQVGIKNNLFEDAARMERLDVLFANLYLQAWHTYTNTGTCTRAWLIVFESSNNDSLVVLQHLLLGMHTHINLDLAIAAATTCKGQAIYGLENDFKKINDIIASRSNQVQESLAQIWFPLRALLQITNDREEPVINFSIAAARKASWSNAVALAQVQGQAHKNFIGMIENMVVKIAARIISPSLATRFLLRPVLLMESRNVGKNMNLLDR